MKEKCNVKCPNCGHIFDSNVDGVFWWSADENGHPTVENICYPHCNAGTESLWSCEYCSSGIASKCTLEDMCPPCNVWSFDSFITFDESGAQNIIEGCQNSTQQTNGAEPQEEITPPCTGCVKRGSSLCADCKDMCFYQAA
jgi:hypothetical protein